MTLLHEKRVSEREVQGASAGLVRYEDDAYGWALQQAALLRAGRLDEIDISNVADEIEDVARREYDKLESALARILQHLLKWDHQPERRSRSWALSIEEHRSRVRDQLSDQPGLKGVRDRAFHRAYRNARLAALRETKLPKAALPEALAYSWDEVMDREIVWSEE